MPEVLQKKNADLIEKLTEIMHTDVDSRKKYNEVVNNKNLMILEKIEELKKIEEEFENKRRHKEDKRIIHTMLNDLDYQLDLIKMDGLLFDSAVSIVQEESELDKLAQQKPPTEKLMKKLEKWLENLKSISMNKNDQELFRTKLWKITEDFEQLLMNDIKGWELEKSMISHHNLERERKLK